MATGEADMRKRRQLLGSRRLAIFRTFDKGNDRGPVAFTTLTHERRQNFFREKTDKKFHIVSLIMNF